MKRKLEEKVRCRVSLSKIPFRRRRSGDANEQALKFSTRSRPDDRTFADQSFPNLPGEDGRILPLVRLDLVHNQRSSDLWLRASDYGVVVRRSEQTEHRVVLRGTEHVQHARVRRLLEQTGRVTVEEATCGIPDSD